MKRRRIVYDIEIFPNFFYVLCKDISNDALFSFEISPVKDERIELLKFLSTTDKLLIGFNNLKFDWPLLMQFENIVTRYQNIPANLLTTSLKNKANSLITSNYSFNNPRILQIDLLKLNHYDNKARMISLKGLEFNMRMMNVQELPFEHTTILTEDEMCVVRDYCGNDIDATTKLSDISKPLIEDRFTSSYHYKTDLLNYNNPKIGEFILISKLKEKLGKEDLGKTPRESINLGEIVFDYVVFDSPAFDNLLTWFKSKTITSTKGVFTEIPIEEVESLKPNINIKLTKKVFLKKLNVVHKGFEFTFGTGGIHGAEEGIFLSNDTHVIMSCDVSSLYPNIAIRNRLYPEHLGEEFCNIYEEIYEERKKYPKTHPQNGNLKLALNGAYGKSNCEFSPLYDPKFTMSITLNGQLLLSMLSEKLMNIPDSKMIMINTDGLEIMIPRTEVDNYYEICKSWELLTKLSLEYAVYDKLIISNCNSYIGIFDNGKVKKKSAYETEPELHKNHSRLVVPKAIEAFYLYGTPIEEFIRNHTDIFDFFLRVKLNKDSRLIAVKEDESLNLPRLTRYLVTTTGYTLIKVMSGNRNFNIEKGFLCTPCNYLTNDLIRELFNTIDYDFYIEKAEKLLIGETDDSDSD